MSPGEVVNHRRHGPGTVLGVRHRGLELEVRFDSGRQLWVRAEDLDAPVVVDPEMLFPAPSLGVTAAAECSQSRALIEGVRMGIVPQRIISDFTVGREREAAQFSDWLNDEATNAMLVVGDYGSGKTHFLEYAYRRAMESGFASALVSIDYNEAPFHKPKRIYEKCVASLRFPVQNGSAMGGYRMLLRRAFEVGELSDHSYFRLVRGTHLEEVWEWIEAREAEGRPASTVYDDFKTFPCMYDAQNAGNVYCYLLSGLSSAAHFADLRGLVLLLDEAEAIDYYTYTYQQDRGRSFLEALIRTAGNDGDLTGPPRSSGLDYCRWASDIPFIYERPCHLKVAFACTPAACGAFPEWLNHDRIDLQPLTHEALEALAGRIAARYADAYGSSLPRILEDARFAGLRDRGGPTRVFVKGCVELMDLARLAMDSQQKPDGANGAFADVAELRRQLPRSWSPFFSRFGGLTSIQLKTVPLVLQGASVVVASPTASGKTEAVAAPVAEMLAFPPPDGLSVIYIVPTRALANDTLRRIGDPLRSMGIEVTLKHGDKPQLPAHGMPHWLVTTPESLDSLLCRRPKAFRDLRVAILDEIHLLDNTFRGDQLRILLGRARRLTQSGALATHLLSATLSSPSELASRYSPGSEVVEVAGQRNIEHRSVRSLAEAMDLAKGQGWRKILCFCNMREAVERHAAELARVWRPYPVMAHHGSLDRRVREEAERVMQEAQTAVCVSTSTLELGVDIGDIDAVVLLEVPWSLSSFLQRVGRGNRRSDSINAVTVAATDDERAAFGAMVKAAANGDLPTDAYKPDLSVCVQQTFSYLYQNPQGVAPQDVLELLSPLCEPGVARDIIAHLLSRGDLETRQGSLFAATAVMDMGEIGKIHSNIADSQRYKVVDEDTGRAIGTISGSFDQAFVLGGRSWKVTHTVDGIVRVRSFPGQAGAALFPHHRGAGAFQAWLPPSLQ